MRENIGGVRLLILGGTGRLARLLRPAFELLPLPPVCLWQGRQVGKGVDLCFDPLAEPEALAAAIGQAEVTLMLAGRITGTAEELAVNSALAAATLTAAAGRPVLLASSAAVYGQERGRLCEDGPALPAAPYGAAKLAMERVAQAATQGSFCCLRIGNVAGADALLGRVAPAGGRKLDVFDTGRSPARSYIGPVALAHAIERLAVLAASGAGLPERLNLALPGAVEMADLLRAAGAAFHPQPAPPGAIPCVELDVSRAIALGLIPADGATDSAAQARDILVDLRRVSPEEPAR
jgi:NDP-hexose 4-ketoreductase